MRTLRRIRRTLAEFMPTERGNRAHHRRRLGTTMDLDREAARASALDGSPPRVGTETR